MADNDLKILAPDEAVELWLKGKYEWNLWVEKNPEYNIDFSCIDFSAHIKGLPFASFEGFHFPIGNVFFEEAQFGSCNVFFNEAHFGNGDVYFGGARFGGDMVSFDRMRCESGNVFFESAHFNVKELSFADVYFGGGVYFADLRGAEEINYFSFKGSIFDGPFEISSDQGFPCLVDFTHIKTSHHVSLDGLKCTLPRVSKRRSRFFSDGDWAIQKTSVIKDNIARARRLKELAEANKDHDAAKDFHVLEMQAKRTHSKCPIGYLWNTEFWYEKLSDYGRSITLPLLWMAHIWWVWTIAYMTVSFVVTDKAQFIKSAVYSTAQMFAFIPSSRDARTKLGDALFGTTPPDLIYVLTFSQSILALMLLFLLGLGLRHRYRI